MNSEYLQKIISKGEGIYVEFKTSEKALNKNVFETVCAFLNRNGGHLLLGVKDNGVITGVDNPEKIINDFNTLANNPQKLNPAFYFSPEIIEIENKKIVYIFIPESSQVHKTKGKIFDRKGDADFDVTNNNDAVTALYLRKQSTYSENEIFLYAGMDDLRSDLFDLVKVLVKNESGDTHQWLYLSNIDILKSAGLFKKDLKTGKSGITLAGILLFGKDETIISVLPHHRTDAILRKINIDRYDDRDDIRTNLLDSYVRLMDFVKKHLPDPFYLEDDKRISLRSKIFREAVVNILIHREYLNPFPAKMIIEKDKVIFENACKPHSYGLIHPETFTPFPKNPNIARVFKEIGYADELGSGVRNLFRYCKFYGKKDPEIIEHDIFRLIVFTPQATPQAKVQDVKGVGEDKAILPQVTPQAEREKKIIDFCAMPRTRDEIQKFLNIRDRKYFRMEILNPLLEKELLFLTIPDKPNSPNQKYCSRKI
jgi:ATP-dependent DNA helicase RecG